MYNQPVKKLHRFKEKNKKRRGSAFNETTLSLNLIVNCDVNPNNWKIAFDWFNDARIEVFREDVFA